MNARNFISLLSVFIALPIIGTEPVASKPEDKPKDATVSIKRLEPMTVIKGEEFMITRPANPTFNRTWKLHKNLPIEIEMIGKAIFVPTPHAGKHEGHLVFKFKGVKPGLAEIEFEKIYPEDLRAKKPLKVRIVPVIIKETQK